MFEKPLFSRLPPKVYEIIFLLLIALMFIALCAEADMYVPAFPQMASFFGVKEYQIQVILSINFTGLCIAGLFAGPLSDSFGRRGVLVGGLFLFAVSSLGCVFSDHFGWMLFWRLLQGIAASTPMVVGAASMFDRYDTEKAGKLIGGVNSLITACMAAAPIAGAWITQVAGWRMNFVVICGLAISLFICCFAFTEETLSPAQRHPFKLSRIFGNYMLLAKSIPFLMNVLIVCFPLAVVVVYVSNLSIIFINHLGVPIDIFGYYQATTMATFVVFSLLSIKCIATKGMVYTQRVGGGLALMGAVSLFWVSKTMPHAAGLICFTMGLVAAGGAFVVSTFGAKAMEIFPEMNGTALALLTAIRQLMTAGLVTLSEVLFDGTITPVATIIFGYAGLGFLCYLFLQRKSYAATQARV